MDAQWIKKRLAEGNGKTQAGLARALSLDPAAINRLLKGGRQIKAYEIPKITEYFDGEQLGGDARPSIYSALPATRPVSGAGVIPVMGVAEGGRDGTLEWSSEVIDHVARPPSLAGAVHGYALYVTGSSMEPRYQHGELLHVNPAKPVTPHSFVVLQFQREEGGTMQALVKQFIKRTSTTIILHQFNPEKNIIVPLDQVSAVHRIVGSGEA